MVPQFASESKLSFYHPQLRSVFPIVSHEDVDPVVRRSLRRPIAGEDAAEISLAHAFQGFQQCLTCGMPVRPYFCPWLVKAGLRMGTVPGLDVCDELNLRWAAAGHLAQSFHNQPLPIGDMAQHIFKRPLSTYQTRCPLGSRHQSNGGQQLFSRCGQSGQ